MRTESSLRTLVDLRRRRHVHAESGGNGQRSNRHGGDGDDLVVIVPVGTVVREVDEDGGHIRVVGDLNRPNQSLMVAHGGRGGRGNARFANAVDRTPRVAERGEPGDQRWLELELQMVADIGLIGAPNAGKSTLLSVLTAAQPKIGSYPFTTLEPELGVVDEPGGRFVLADLPGLIEGAAQGAGLGHDFLRHASRVRAFVHVIDGSGLESDPHTAYRMVRSELERYSAELAQRPEIIVINKLDLPGADETLRQFVHRYGEDRVVGISAAAHQGMVHLRSRLWQMVEMLPPVVEQQPEPEPERPDPTAFRIVPEGDGFRVEGITVERRVAMTDMQNQDAVRHLARYLRRKGVEQALRNAGAQPGTTVYIRDVEFDLSDNNEFAW